MGTHACISHTPAESSHTCVSSQNHHREVIQGVTLPWLLPKAAVAARTHTNVGYGTCEAQVLRSTCEWSIGSGAHTETSILHAYRYAISTAEHFIYIGTLMRVPVPRVREPMSHCCDMRAAASQRTSSSSVRRQVRRWRTTSWRLSSSASARP
jgi:phospholipase D1/2